MSIFHENLKQILAEVEKFLNESLKKEKLGKKAAEHKALILEKLESFFLENPTMKLNLSQETVSVSDDSVMTGGSTVSDESEGAYNETGLPFVGVADLTEPVFSGFLEKKQKKGSGLFGSSKFQTRWCVLHKGNFYYFARQDDKKQNGSFHLEGYAFRNAPDLSTKKKEKDLCFELYHSDEKKRTYQFMAKSKEDYEKWQTFVESGGHELIEEDIYEEVGPEKSTPDPVSPKVEETPAPDLEQDEVYEETDSLTDPPVQPPLPPPPASKNLPPPPPPPVSRSPSNQPKSPHPTPAPVDNDPNDEIYDDALSGVNPPDEPLPPPPPVPGRSQPPPTPPAAPTIPKRPTRDLPPTPQPKKRIKISLTCKPTEDFENKFYGKWDCTADNASELSFKRGDVIHILSREFDEKSWWIGELNGNFGLVPKTFLVPTYTLVTQ